MAGISTRTNRLAAAGRALTASAALLVLAPGEAPAVAPVRRATLCLPGETPLFSCSIGVKIASVCGGKAGGVYRYGRPGRVELTARDLSTAYRGFAGGGGMQITARSGRFRYTVYTKTVRTNFDASGRHDPQNLSGLTVRLGAKTIMSKSCALDPILEGDAAKLIPTGAYLED